MAQATPTRTAAWLGFVLLIAGQCAVLAHAAEHGTGPHDHNGVECTLIAQDDDDTFVPPGLPLAPAPSTVASADASQRFAQRLQRWNTPPETGPPSLAPIRGGLLLSLLSH